MLITLLCGVTFFPATSQAELTNVKDCIKNKSDCSELDSSGTDTKIDETKEKNDDNSTNEGSSSSLFFDLVKLFVALAFVLGLIYFLLKVLNRKNKMFQKVRTLENMGGISLGQSKSLQVVRIGERIYVIGVGDNVEMLSEITEEKTKQEILTGDKEADFNPANLLSFLSSNQKQDKQDNKEASNSKGFQQMFQTELNRLKQGRRKIIQQKNKDKDTDKHE